MHVTKAWPRRQDFPFGVTYKGWKHTTPIIGSTFAALTLASNMANMGPAHSLKLLSNPGPSIRILLIPFLPDGPTSIILEMASQVPVSCGAVYY